MKHLVRWVFVCTPAFAAGILAHLIFDSLFACFATSFLVSCIGFNVTEARPERGEK